MYTLFIDTHNELITIVLYKNGKIISNYSKASKMSHSVHTMPLIDSILKDNNITIKDINEIIVVNGPGSFTGVRIGVTIAKTLAYTLDINIKTITSLEVLAVSLEDIQKNVFISDKNGKFIGLFNEKNELIEDYFYLNNSEFEIYCADNKKDFINNIEVDYEKVYEFLENIKGGSAHSIKPIYVKNIEVVNGKKS